MVPTQTPPSVMAGLAPLSRRSLLRFTAIAGLALTTGCAQLLGRREAPSAVRYAHLSDDEVRLMTKLVRAILTTEAYGLPDPIDDVPTLKNIDVMVGNMASNQRTLLRLGFFIFDHRPIAGLKFKRFSSLSDEEATRYFIAMQEGPFFERGLATSMKALITLNYWRDPQTWAALDYWGPVTERWGITRLGNQPLPEA